MIPSRKEPVLYSDELADRICEIISVTAKGIHQICLENEGMPSPSTIFKWLHVHPYFKEQYARAKESQHWLLAEQILAIADNNSQDVLREKLLKNADGTFMIVKEENVQFVNRSKVQIDARKWLLAKLMPKVFGDAPIEKDEDNTLKIIVLEDDEQPGQSI